MAENCTCRPWPAEIPISAVRGDDAWRWTCQHGNDFIRRDPSWERVHTYDEIVERLAE